MNASSTKTNLQIYNASAGSGKTFTLVAEYLKILFQADSKYAFKTILAITFTNKAAAEMKIRVLDSLKAFSKPVIPKSEKDLFDKISTELVLEPKEIQQKAILIIKTILNNYAAFNITTIDSFTYKLIRSFAFDLGIALNFEVEMDAISLLNEAVDVLISRIGEDKSLTKTLINFSISKSIEDKSWDISVDLKDIAKLLLNENDILQVNKIKQKPIKDFIDLQTNINKQRKETEKQFKALGEQGLKLINDLQIEPKDFYRSQFPSYFNKLATNVAGIKFEKDSSLARNIEKDIFYAKSKPQAIKSAIDSIKTELIQLFRESEKLFEGYLLNKLIGKSLIPLAILQNINKVLTEIKEDNNIRLISEFNQLISKHLKEQPAAFIYEKIGERFQHYFIDEMQDTSTMQWENLIPLLDNVLTSQNEKGQTGSLLLVGDAKQAIYRWRGGKAEQFIELANKDGENPFLVEKKVANLDTNWRSYSEIIDFNNTFFQHIAKYLQNDAYRKLYKIGNKQKQNPKKGGYVEIQFIEKGLKSDEKLKIYPEKVLEIIKNLEDSFAKKDICILTRTRKQGVAIAEYLTANNVAIISSETLLLQNSPKVNFMMDLLHFIQQPKDKERQFEILYFIHNHYKIKTEKHQFINQFIPLEGTVFFTELQSLSIVFDLNYFKSLSLYESIEYLIRNFNLTKTSDAYLQFFLDLILDFSLKKNEGLGAFLQYWEEKKEKLSIVVPNEKEAVHIMTIHKAKGLEFPVVIYPFDLDIYHQINPKIWYEPLDKEKYNGFDSALINFNKFLPELGKVGAHLYQTQREELELDNFNLLYVALTRAKEQLYIISEHKDSKDTPQNYSQFFIEYLENKGLWHAEQSIYTFGKSERLSSKKEKNNDNIDQTSFISSDWRQHNIHIVPSSLSQEDKVENAREYGNLIHEILAKITTSNDVATTLKSFMNKGFIPSEKEKEITNIINKVVHHKELKSFFTKAYSVMNEREILTGSGDIIIPDRFVFNNEEAVVIDYKTGKAEKKHLQQINNYATVLQKMDFNITKKLLVYIDDTIEVIEAN